MKKLLLCFVALLLSAAPAPAGIIVGPGDAGGDWHDSAYDLIAVDLNAPASLGAGTYVASQFNYQFIASVVGGTGSTELNGSVTPILLTGGGTSFTPVAVGDTIVYTGPTGFISAPFAGADSFTLAAGMTVYAGLYWHANPDGLDDRMPVGYENFTGNDFVVYGGGFGPGANAPVVGTPISGSAEGFFSRVYDFSIEVEPASAVVPEPSTLLLAIVGFGGLCAWGSLRSKCRFAL